MGTYWVRRFYLVDAYGTQVLAASSAGNGYVGCDMPGSHDLRVPGAVPGALGGCVVQPSDRVTAPPAPVAAGPTFSVLNWLSVELCSPPWTV